jgi:limonene-1,2-epoxide hydrolase
VNEAVKSYYAALDAGHMESAVEQFTEDTVFIRPRSISSTDGTPGLDVICGREALLSFLRRRGKHEIRHWVRTIATVGQDVWVEGVVAGIAGDETPVFLAHAILDEHGQIKRWLAMAEGVVREDFEIIEASGASHDN